MDMQMSPERADWERAIKQAREAFKKGVGLRFARNDSLHAFVLLKGEENRDWIEVSVDEVEWTNPYYCHQN